MLQSLPKVNRFTTLLTLIFCSYFLTACTHSQGQIHNPPNWKFESFVSHDTWLAVNVEYEPAHQIRNQIETLSQSQLKNRGEAHITVITPPEYEKLKKYVSMTEINKMALDQGIDHAKWKNICVGSGAITQGEKILKTYYVVVSSPDLLRFREMIEDFIQDKGATPEEFKSSPYYPHITLGFTERDLHESDGVIKDDNSCFFEIVDPTGQKIQ